MYRCAALSALTLLCNQFPPLGIPWRSSGQDSMFSLLRAQVWPLVSELRAHKVTWFGLSKHTRTNKSKKLNLYAHQMASHSLSFSLQQPVFYFVSMNSAPLGTSYGWNHMVFVALPWWLSSKESACQGRRRRFDPWVRKIPWRRKWLPTLVFLPGKSYGQRSLAGYSLWGRNRVGCAWATSQQMAFVPLRLAHLTEHLPVL